MGITHPLLRPYRSTNLRQQIAIMGLKLIIGGGRAEADAAHIRQVETHSIFFPTGLRCPGPLIGCLTVALLTCRMISKSSWRGTQMKKFFPSGDIGEYTPIVKVR
ncbi:hypothetical protein [Rhizobium leguminosarum]|uniref:hypothetical protein n=1 Tax=Rhizobium leguminosarum TaxID=384 RepID=UPI003D7C1553